jgi:hypothetical protein
MGLLDLADRVIGASDPLLEQWEKPQPLQLVRDLADELQAVSITGRMLRRPADYNHMEDPALRRAIPYMASKGATVMDRTEFERISRSVLRMDADVSAGRLADEPRAIADRLVLEEKMSYLAKAATPTTQRGDFLDLSPGVDADRTWRLAVSIGSMPDEARHALSEGRFEEVPRRQLRLMAQTASPAKDPPGGLGILAKARDAITPGRTEDRAKGMDPRLVDAFRRYDGGMRDATATFAPWAEGKPGSKDRQRWIRSSFEEATRPLFATDGLNPQLAAAIDAQALRVLGSQKPIAVDLDEQRSQTAGYVAHMLGRDPVGLSVTLDREASSLAHFGDEYVLERLEGSARGSRRELPPRDLDDGVSRTAAIADWLRSDMEAASEGRLAPEVLVKRSVTLASRKDAVKPADPVEVAASVPPLQPGSLRLVSPTRGPAAAADDGVAAAVLSASRGSSR